VQGTGSASFARSLREREGGKVEGDAGQAEEKHVALERLGWGGPLVRQCAYLLNAHGVPDVRM
jgi:hypothetical protein